MKNHCMSKRALCFVVGCYTAVQIKNCLKSISVIKSSHYEKYGQFPNYARKPSHAQFFFSEDDGTIPNKP